MSFTFPLKFKRCHGNAANLYCRPNKWTNKHKTVQRMEKTHPNWGFQWIQRIASNSESMDCRFEWTRKFILWTGTPIYISFNWTMHTNTFGSVSHFLHFKLLSIAFSAFYFKTSGRLLFSGSFSLRQLLLRLLNSVKIVFGASSPTALLSKYLEPWAKSIHNFYCSHFPVFCRLYKFKAAKTADSLCIFNGDNIS